MAFVIDEFLNELAELELRFGHEVGFRLMYPKEKVGRLQLLPIFGNGKAERYGDFFLKLCDEPALGSIVVAEKYENIFWQQVGGRVHTFNPMRDNLTTEGER